jgi:hypothetical protein
MKNKKLFAAAVMARKEINNGTTVQDKPVILQAYSEEEAIGICLLSSKKDWFPEKEGWHDHQVSVVEFPAT